MQILTRSFPFTKIRPFILFVAVLNRVHIYIYGGIVQLYTQSGKKFFFLLASKMFERSITLDPIMALLNLRPDFLTHKQFRLLLTLVKQPIAKAWKLSVLNIAETKYKMNHSLMHAKMDALDTDNLKKFETLWRPWITHCLLNNFDCQVLSSW